MNKKTIIYIGNFLFPQGDAASNLVESNGRILDNLGYNVIFIGKDSIFDSNSSLMDTKKYYEFSEYFTIPFPNGLKKLVKSCKRYNDVIELFKLYKYDLDAVILYGSPATNSFLVYKIKKWCMQNGIPFIGNIADISALSHGTIVERVAKWSNYLILRSYLKYGTNGVIAVSKYIKDYFSYKQKSMVIIPPLVNTEQFPKPYMEDSSKIVLVYAGIPFPIDGRRVDVSSYKDRIDIVIELLNEVYKITQNFRLDIYGLTKEQYLNVVKKDKDILDEMSEAIVFHGKTYHKQVLTAVSGADFTINLRDVNRMTMAGFSTKFVESVSCGTPIITTNTSDLENYLEQGKNGFFIDIENKENAIKTLVTIFNFSKEEIFSMKKYCYKSRKFDYRNYIDKIEDFLSSLS